MIRWLLLPIMLLSMQAFSQEQSLPKTSADPEPNISVHISPKDSRLRRGQDVLLRVEIWNESKQDLFISKEINFTSITGLELTVSKDGVTHTQFPIISDSFSSVRANYPPLSIELSKYWIALPPGHFYGGEVVLTPLEFPVLRTPGKCRIQGKYSSQGFLANNINNPLAHYAEELKKLPFHSWAGEVETNPTWIEVISTSSSLHR